MAAAGDATRVEVTFVAGPLGLGLAESRRVVKVTEGGAADTLGVRVGDVLLVVGDRDVSGLAYEEVLAHIKAAPRPVRLLHGQRDPDVPWQLALRIAERLESDDVRVTLIKDGDHRLSRPQDLALLIGTVDELIG